MRDELGPGARHPARTSARRAPAPAGAVASTAATVSRRFSPPDSVYGFASASARQPQPLEQLVDARRDLGGAEARAPAARPRAPRARSWSSSWCSGSWNTVPMRVSSCARRPADRVALRARRRAERMPRPGPAAGGSSPASVRPSVDLPAPLGPVIAEHLAGAAPSRSMPDRRPACRARARRRATPRRSSVSPGGRAAARGGKAGRDAGNPHAAGGELAAPSRRAPRRACRRRSTPAVATEHDARGRRAAATRRRRCSTTTSVAPVRIEHARARRRAPRRRPSGSRFAVGSSSRMTPGRIASTPGEREPLLLPAATAPRSSRSSGTSSPTASSASRTRGQISLARDAEVLAAERDVVADAREDRLAVGILQHHARATARARGRLAVDRAARRSARPRRRRRARRRGRAAASTCPSRRRRAAAPAPPARCGTRHPAPPSVRRVAWRQPHPRASTAAGATRADRAASR